jgi:non-ribosomal peptide synthetase component E (peptide arylation enzyme)
VTTAGDEATMGGGTFWALAQKAAQHPPESVLLADDYGRSLTAIAFRDEAERAAAGLLARRIGPGDVVSWQLPTTLEAAVLIGAWARLGVVQNPIIPVYRHREVGFIAEQARARLLVAPETWRGFGHGDTAATRGCHGRGRMPVGTARGGPTLLDRRAGGLPGRGI